MLVLTKPFAEGLASAAYTYDAQESLRKAAEESAKRVRAHYQAICKEKNVQYNTVKVRGNPSELIPKFIKDLNCDALVMGSHGRGLLKR